MIMITSRDELRRFLRQKCNGRFLEDEPLAKHTCYRIGGPADFFIYPADELETTLILGRCLRLEIPFYIIGEGANILASDNGFRGAVISLTRAAGSISIEDNRIRAGAGAALRSVVYAAECQGLAGIEMMAGIPGTIGGALSMNAGTDDGDIGSVVESVDILDKNLKPATLNRQDIAFGYRCAPQLQGVTVIGCWLRLHKGNASELTRKRLELLARRAAKQPLEYPSCGSVFKRPAPNCYVGSLIEMAGLKGLRKGDAMISVKHAGFIVNLGNATAQDILGLIDTVRTEIHHRFGITLELEVRLLGF